MLNPKCKGRAFSACPPLLALFERTVYVLLDLTLTRTIKSVVTGHAPVTLEWNVLECVMHDGGPTEGYNYL